MLFLVATNVVTSRPPERRWTGTPHARANNLKQVGPTPESNSIFKCILVCGLRFDIEKF